MHGWHFKTALCRQITFSERPTAIAWADRLKKLRHRPMSDEQVQSIGFSPVFGDDGGEEFCYQAGEYLFLTLLIEQRKANALRAQRAVRKALKAEADREGLASSDDLKGSVRKMLREKAIVEETRKATPTEKYINIIIATRKKLIFIDRTSGNDVERVEGFLRHIDTETQSAPFFKGSLKSHLTAWLYPDHAVPDDLRLEEDATLQEGKSKAVLSGQMLEGDEMASLLNAGKEATELGFSKIGVAHIRVNEDGILKKIVFADEREDALNEAMNCEGDINSQYAACWSLNADTLVELFDWLAEITEMGARGNNVTPFPLGRSRNDEGSVAAVV